MLVTISQITRHLHAAEDALRFAQQHVDNNRPEEAQALAQISNASSKLALAYMYARETSILAAGNDPNQAPLPFE